MRLCKKCSTHKPLKDFHFNGKKKDGTQKYRHECKICYNDRMRSIRYEVISTVHPVLRCQQCGFVGERCQFDLHHRDPTEKSFNVSKSRGMSRKVILEEVKKCDLLCSNCHRLEHAN